LNPSGLIDQFAREAIDVGDLPADEVPARLSFELDSLMIGADANFVLLGDRSYLDEGRAAVRRRLGLG
jgi:hypothetical protein